MLWEYQIKWYVTVCDSIVSFSQRQSLCRIWVLMSIFSILYLLLLPLFLHSQACCQTCWLEERWVPGEQLRVGRRELQQNKKNQFNHGTFTDKIFRGCSTCRKQTTRLLQMSKPLDTRMHIPTYLKKILLNTWHFQVVTCFLRASFFNTWIHCFERDLPCPSMVISTQGRFTASLKTWPRVRCFNEHFNFYTSQSTTPTKATLALTASNKPVRWSDVILVCPCETEVCN